MFEIEHVASVQNEVGESPRWDAAEQAVYWLDIWDSPAVFRFQPSTGELTRWTPGLPVTGQARREAGGFVFATRQGIYLWDERSGESEFIHDPEANNRPVRFNDGSADRSGRFWAGSTHADDQFRPEGSLYRMTARPQRPENGRRAGLLQRAGLEPGQPNDVRHCPVCLRAARVRFRPGQRGTRQPAVIRQSAGG